MTFSITVVIPGIHKRRRTGPQPTAARGLTGWKAGLSELTGIVWAHSSLRPLDVDFGRVRLAVIIHYRMWEGQSVVMETVTAWRAGCVTHRHNKYFLCIYYMISMVSCPRTLWSFPPSPAVIASSIELGW